MLITPRSEPFYTFSRTTRHCGPNAINLTTIDTLSQTGSDNVAEFVGQCRQLPKTRKPLFTMLITPRSEPFYTFSRTARHCGPNAINLTTIDTLSQTGSDNVSEFVGQCRQLPKTRKPPFTMLITPRSEPFYTFSRTTRHCGPNAINLTTIDTLSQTGSDNVSEFVGQ
jgi:rRNA maturation protein Nop10